MAITETWLEEEIEFSIKGYQLFRNDRNEDGGGVLIAVKDVLENITVEVNRTSELYESIWVSINNGKAKLKVGVVYLPQEKVSTEKDYSHIFKQIKKEIAEGRDKEQNVILTGDFNCKVGDRINGNVGPISKGGKKLIKMIEKEKLVILNASEKCEGKWTRDENEEKSIIDYVIIDEEDEKFITSLKIDEEKEYAPFRLKQDNNQIKTVYSDHNAMILKTKRKRKKQRSREEIYDERRI